MKVNINKIERSDARNVATLSNLTGRDTCIVRNANVITVRIASIASITPLIMIQSNKITFGTPVMLLRMEMIIIQFISSIP